MNSNVRDLGLARELFLKILQTKNVNLCWIILYHAFDCFNLESKNLLIVECSVFSRCLLFVSYSFLNA